MDKSRTCDKSFAKKCHVGQIENTFKKSGKKNRGTYMGVIRIARDTLREDLYFLLNVYVPATLYGIFNFIVY